jgi:catechol 2,3-dioxygenase-like lactoylglutathione lyase family enzyme
MRVAANSQLRTLALSIALIVTIQSISAQTSAPVRPRITGISHGGYFVSDLPKALAFWHDFLGFDESYDLKKPGSTTETRIAFIKINDRQHIELFTDAPATAGNMLSHICFTVDDIEQMRAYLRANGYDVKPGGGKTRTGDYAFEIKDPDGMLVEFVQSLPDGLEVKAAGKFEPATRISTHIYHLGFMVGNSERSLDFYGRILGFKEIWRGGGDPAELSWINMRVPDGTDYVEFMLYRKFPTPDQWGGKNHIALEVPDMAKAVATLAARPAFKAYGKPLNVQVGKNGKRQVNLYDPDGTRIELMEPFTADGKPVPPSTAPPPPPSHD